MMKKIQVEVCVCTACVMNGSVDIMESVESLRDLRDQMEDNSTRRSNELIEIVTDKCLGGEPHSQKAPMVAIDGKVFPKADAESVMAHIIECIKENTEA